MQFTVLARSNTRNFPTTINIFAALLRGMKRTGMRYSRLDSRVLQLATEVPASVNFPVTTRKIRVYRRTTRRTYYSQEDTLFLFVTIIQTFAENLSRELYEPRSGFSL